MTLLTHQQAHSIPSAPRCSASIPHDWPPTTRSGTAVLDALEDNGVLVFPDLHLDPEAQVAFCRRLGEVDHSSDGHHPVAGIYPITLDKSKNCVGGLPAGDVRLAHRRLHADRRRVPAEGDRAVGHSGRRAAAERRSSPTPTPPMKRSATRRRSGSKRCAWCTRWRRRSAGSTPIRRRKNWRGGGRGPRTSIRWSGRIAAGESRWCSARPRTTSSVWTSGRGQGAARRAAGPRHPTRPGVQPPLVGRRHRHLGQPRRAAPRGSVRPRLATGNVAHHSARRRTDPVTTPPVRGLTPLPAEEWDDGARHAVSPLLPGRAGQPARRRQHPGHTCPEPALTHAYLTFNAHLLLKSSLSARVREVALLRAALAPVGLSVGPPRSARPAGRAHRAEIEEIRNGDAVRPNSTDCSCAPSTNSTSTTRSPTPTWAALGEHFDEISSWIWSSQSAAINCSLGGEHARHPTRVALRSSSLTPRAGMKT